tara:strand:- start:1648 stop:2736 length:1089 start_codon:yes stop_codon:yes gene_type:complete
MFVADLHNDILQRAIIGEDITKKSENGHSDIVRLLESKINLEVFVIWVTKQYLEKNAFNRANELIDKLEEIEKQIKSLIVIKSLEDLNLSMKESYLATPFGIEGGECLEDSLDNLMHFIRRGLLYLGPTWNFSNSIATSAYDETLNSNKIDYLGLSKFGIEVVKLCNESGVIIDVSHIGEKSFWDIINLSTEPVIASHSCVYNLRPHYRNLKDDQIIAIKKKHGVVFINLYPYFFDLDFEEKENNIKLKFEQELKNINSQFTDQDERWINRQFFLQKKLKVIASDLSKYIDHIEYIIKLVGIDYVGIGSDYDGIDCLPSQISDCTDHMLIAKELDKRGFLFKDIEKVMGLNFLRVYEQIKSK